MDLFNNLSTEPINLLSQDGIAEYYGVVLPWQDSERYFNSLLDTIAWESDRVVINHKEITTKRKVAWYGDKPFDYTYSNTKKTALPWTDDLLELKNIVEQKTTERFNSCLLNLYHNGSEGMSWHSDNEADLKKQAAIASLSLGAERKFSFKHRQTKQTVSLMLENGSLLVMKGKTQSHWVHCLPPTKKVDAPRINLTFRTIVDCLS